jgi:hypothetical protein
MKKVLFFLLISMICVTCRRKAPSFDPVFVGNWHGSSGCQRSINIDDESNGIYTSTGGKEECDKTISGKPRAGKHVLVIGLHHFKIIEYPVQIPDTMISPNTIFNGRMKIEVPSSLPSPGTVVLFRIK